MDGVLNEKLSEKVTFEQICKHNRRVNHADIWVKAFQAEERANAKALRSALIEVFTNNSEVSVAETKQDAPTPWPPLIFPITTTSVSFALSHFWQFEIAYVFNCVHFLSLPQDYEFHEGNTISVLFNRIHLQWCSVWHMVGPLNHMLKV